MDAGRRKDTVVSGRDEPVDEYSLSFWFAPGAPDRLIKQTSETAAHWHQWVDQLTRESGQGAVPYSQRNPGGAKVLKPKRTHFVAPTYPDQALKEGLSGSVTVNFIVDVRGEPTEPRIVA